MRAIGLLLILGAAGGVPAFAAGTPQETLLALSKSDHTLAIVDPATLKVLARVPIGEDPHEVIASTDGTRAYVSNYGGGAYNTLAVVDLVAQKRLPSIDLGALRGPHGLIFVGGKTWFTAEAAKAIGSYDPARNAIDWIMGTGQNGTHMIFVSSDLKRIVTTNIGSGTVSIIDRIASRPPPLPPPSAPGAGPGPGPGGPPPRSPAGDWDETVVPVGKRSEGFDVTPDGKEVWVANAQDGTVSIVDLAAKKVKETLEANVMGANRLKFTPNGQMAFISSLGGAGLAILDVATRKEIKRLDLGSGAAGIQMQPDGARAYVACTGGNYIAVIDLKALSVTGRIDAGPQPDGMAWSIRR